jgi:hypothetical protein
MAETTPPVEDVPADWLDYLTAGAGILMGVLLVAMGIDSIRRIHILDSELDKVAAGDNPHPHGLRPVRDQGSGDDAA